MEVRKGVLWYLVNGAMELSWFLGWAMFCSLMTMHRPFPFYETIVAFALAGFVTTLSTGRGWRIIGVLGLEGLGLTCAALLLIHGLYYGSYPLLDGGWLLVFYYGSRSVTEWLILSMNLVLITILLRGGMILVRRPKGYSSVCDRFDLGLAAFFALFIIKLVAMIKGEAMAEDSLSLLFVFPFFLFGLLSIGIARMRGAASNSFLPGYRGIGIIVSFVAAVLLGTGGLVLFFLPGLTAAAHMGHRALTVVGRPLVPLLLAFLRFVFGPRGNRPAAVATESDRLGDWEKILPQTQSWWMDLLEKVIGWGLLGVMVLAMLAVSAIALFYVLKWLFSRTKVNKGQPKPIPLWFTVLWAFLVYTCRKMVSGIRGHQKATELYGALLGWSRHSGLPHDHSETPLELGMRLNTRFPTLKSPIGLIIDAYNREVYGETVLGVAPLAAAKSAWQFLRSPFRWPTRFKGWFTGSSSTR